jgi:membrane protein
MHRKPQYALDRQAKQRNSESRVPPFAHRLSQLMLRFLHLLRLALWRAFQHDAFAVAKASAYSSILTFFPALLVLGSILATSSKFEVCIREISYALGRILPAGTATAVDYLRSTYDRPVKFLIMTSLLTTWTASGAMISWMEGFLLVAFGGQIEASILVHIGHEFGPYILLMWTGIRWAIAILTSVAVIALIYHNAVPRTQPWHSVLPGASLATCMWFGATLLFGWYLKRYADYSVIYGSLEVGIALLVWMYLVSIVVLVGAEFNALLYPRCVARRPAPFEIRHRMPPPELRGAS